MCIRDRDVAIGAGLSAFINRPDSVDLTATLIEKGYNVYLDWKSVLKTSSDKFVGILSMGDVHRRNKSSNTTASAADGAEVCLAAKLAATSAESNDTTYFSEPTLYLEKATAKAIELLEDPQLEEKGARKLEKLLSEKVDINRYYLEEMDRLIKAGRKG